MSWLTKYLGITAEHNDTLGEGAESVKTIAEFFGDVTEKIPDLADKLSDIPEGSLSDAINASLPWVEGAADAVGEALPPLKAVLSLVKFLTREPDPHAL